VKIISVRFLPIIDYIILSGIILNSTIFEIIRGKRNNQTFRILHCRRPIYFLAILLMNVSLDF
jgi:hypothetical protein